MGHQRKNANPNQNIRNGVACKCNQSTKQVYTLIISNIPHKAYKDIYIYIYLYVYVSVSVYTANYMLIP